MILKTFSLLSVLAQKTEDHGKKKVIDEAVRADRQINTSGN